MQVGHVGSYAQVAVHARPGVARRPPAGQGGGPTEGTTAAAQAYAPVTVGKPKQDDATKAAGQATQAVEATRGAEEPTGAEGTNAQLTKAEQEEVRELEKRDREVRAHENAHAAAAGSFAAGGPSFETVRGPDGKQYAVAGEVPIDVSEAASPEATLRKAQAIQRAALAPADPSSADRAIAAKAGRMAAEASAQMAKEALDTGPQEEGSTASSETAPASRGYRAVRAYAAIEAASNERPSAVAGSKLAPV